MHKFIRTSLLNSLAVFAPALVFAAAPTFNNGGTQTMSACASSSARSINSLLAISDADAGDTETWSVAAGPVHGTLAGFSASAPSTGGTLTPSGLTYTPAGGYTGADSFTIQVSDGSSTATTTVYVTVNALPTLSSTRTPGPVCDQSTFNYTPASASAGATFAWTRPYTGGISNPTASGIGNPNEILVNTTTYDVPVSYLYTIAAGGCSNTQNVTVTVHPTPRLNSATEATICSGGSFDYTPTSLTSGTTYTWSRASVAGISPAASSGSGSIHETLTNSTSASLVANYRVVLTANGCTAARNVAVTVTPESSITAIATTSPATVCAGTMYQNFGAGLAPSAGVTYTWGAINATVAGVGSNGQYALVSFPNPGDAYVTLTVMMGSAACTSRDTFIVHVNTSAAPTSEVLYYGPQFIYLDNTMDSYQWGYDNASTLDSTLIPGAGFQSYVISSPDFTNNYYWVITSKNGCIQKTYYNRPLAITNISNGTVASIKVYPNPASDAITVASDAMKNINTEVAVINITGQIVKTQMSKGSQVQFNITDLPAGCYMISCSQNGARMAITKFIKN